jgi:hypothetical protein
MPQKKREKNVKLWPFFFSFFHQDADAFLIDRFETSLDAQRNSILFFPPPNRRDPGILPRP